MYSCCFKLTLRLILTYQNHQYFFSTIMSCIRCNVLFLYIKNEFPLWWNGTLEFWHKKKLFYVCSVLVIDSPFYGCYVIVNTKVYFLVLEIHICNNRERITFFFKWTAYSNIYMIFGYKSLSPNSQNNFHIFTYVILLLKQRNKKHKFSVSIQIICGIHKWGVL